MGRHHDIPIKYNKIKDTFHLKRKIGKGSFGIIYSADNINTKERVAVKFEKVSQKRKNQTTLLKEAKILHLLFKKKVDGFPKIVYFNADDCYRMLIMNLLGRNLQRCLEKADNKLHMGTVLKIAVQLLERLEALHNLGYIHRDLKPENVCTDLKKSSDKIFLIDLGLAKKYTDDKGKHIMIREKRGLVGTIRYTSINSHLSIEQSRRDDMESLGYILVYLAKGKLPWQGLIFFDEDMRMRRIAELKCSIKVEKLTEGLPRSFQLFFKHVKTLKFTQRPDYDYLTSLFMKTADDLKINLKEYCFEWQTKKKSGANKKFGQKSSLKVKHEDDINDLKKAMNSSGNLKIHTVNQITEMKKVTDIKKMPFSSSHLKIPNNHLKNVNNGSNFISYESKNSNMPFSINVVKDTGSNISKEEINQLDGIEMEEEFKDDPKKKNEKKKSIFGNMTTLKEEDDEYEEEKNRQSGINNNKENFSQHSEDFSQDVMDENANNIQKKIAITTLTQRYNYLL